MIINPSILNQLSFKRWDEYVLEKQRKKLHWIK